MRNKIKEQRGTEQSIEEVGDGRARAATGKDIG